MPTSAEELWQELERQTESIVPDRFREFVFATDFLIAEWKSDDPKRQQNALHLARRLLDAARDVGWLETASDATEGIVVDLGDGDERWTLWRDLLDKVAQIRGRRPRQEWQVLRLAKIFDVALTPLTNHLVQVTFDSRLSREALFAQLTRQWPEMVHRGWVRRTRRSKDGRPLALIRFVCLELPAGLTWEQRRLAWNESRFVQQHPSWREGDYRAFETAFSRAETALAGQRDGLAPLYREPRRELGDREVLWAPLLAAQFDQRRLAWAREIRKVQELLGAGLPPEGVATQLRSEGGEWGQLDAELALEAVRRMAQEDLSTYPDPDLGEIAIVSESERWLEPGRETDPIGVMHGVNMNNMPETIAAIQALHRDGVSDRDIAIWKEYPVDRVRQIIAMPMPISEDTDWVREHVEATLKRYREDHPAGDQP